MDKINNIKFGLKLWSADYKLVREFNEMKGVIEKGIFDYVELMVVPDSEIYSFQKIIVPYIIHISHENLGVNIADNKKEEFNLKMINQSIKWADKLNAKYLILHPGFGEVEIAKDFLAKVNDKRILIENMPKIGTNNEKMLGFTPEEIRELKKDKFGFCLDFGHTIKAAASLGKNYKQYIKEFLTLNPQVFHISDGVLNKEKDEHLNIGEGEYDFKFLVKCIKENKSKYVTMETPRNNLNSLKEDLENLKKLKSIFL